MTCSEPAAGGVTAEDVLHAPPAWRCQATPAEGGVRLVADGELDLAVVPALEDVIRTLAIAPSEVMRVDLTGVRFIDSSVVALLLRLHRRAARTSGRLEIAVRPDSGVMRTLTICGASQILNVVSPTE
jgi:anti-anti-sigma factor